MKLFYEGIDRPGLNTRKVYEKAGGYKVLKKALKMEPDDVRAGREVLPDKQLRRRRAAGA